MSKGNVRPPVAMLRDPGHLLALGFGSGLAPKAPGTFGTVVGVMCFLGLHQLSTTAFILSVIALFLIGIPICSRTAKALGVHDHGAIVFDEIVGFLATMAFVDLSWMSLLLGFLLFRAFDILKPWPIGLLDRRVSGGFGIMLDDLVAAGFAALGMEIFKYLSYI